MLLYIVGVADNGLGTILFSMYKIFLLVWIIIGLGYVVMVLGFISRGLRSKQVHQIEHLLANNIKKTPYRIREEFRAILHDFLITKVKRVYKGEFVYTPRKIERSVSCPDLRIYRNEDSPISKRRRALSEALYVDYNQRIQSDTELDKIDKERTFEPAKALMKQTDLLMQVVNALGSYRSSDESDDSDGGIHCFSDEEILASEKIEIPKRKRAFSEIQFPFANDYEKSENLTWSGPLATKQIIEMREKVKYGKCRNRATVPEDSTPSLIQRIRNTFKSPSKENVKNFDVEAGINDSSVNQTKSGQSLLPDFTPKYAKTKTRKYSVPESVLENTSIAELFRAITAISTPPNETINPLPKRKLGIASLTPPLQVTPLRHRRLAIRPVNQSRRSSLLSNSNHETYNRRLSLNPTPLLKLPDITITPSTTTPLNAGLPPTGRRSIRVPGSNRRYSLRPVTNATITPSPVQRQILKAKDKDDQGQ